MSKLQRRPRRRGAEIELAAFQVRKLVRPGLHAVGGVAGLHLQVQPSGARSWILRVKIGDRRPDIGLGRFPDVTLEQARDRARTAREQIRNGIDPIAARRDVQAQLRAAAAKRLTFDEAAAACHKARETGFKNAKHAKQWKATLDTYASPVIGALPVDRVEVGHVVKILEPLWSTKTETASRLRGRIEAVLAWATVSGYRAGENPARWKANLDHILPKTSSVKTVEHHPALPWQQVPEFMVDLRRQSGVGARALEFALLTAARSSEVRLATWKEIDVDAKVWAVPAEHIKGKKVHRVPLSDAALNVLAALPRLQGSRHVFPAPRKGAALSDATLSAVIQRMHETSLKAGGVGYLDPTMDRVATPHGTARSSFKDWCRASTAYPDEVSELALAHIDSDATRAAYARDELLPQRARLMKDWARFCAAVPKKASVTTIRGSRSK